VVLSANVLRLGSLVAAATASGYLWRAALEPSGRTKVLRVATPSVAFKVPGAPINPFARPPLVHGEALKAKGPVVRRKARRRVVTRPRRARSAVLIARTAPTRSRARARSVGSTRRRRPVAPRPVTRPAKPPPQRPPAPPPPPPVQPQPPAPPPPAPPPPPPPVVVPPGGRDDDLDNNWPPGQRRNRDEARKDEKSGNTRPGWGRGDKNHEHTGPPGQQKDKKNKK
jgi:hypothetical protein